MAGPRIEPATSSSQTAHPTEVSGSDFLAGEGFSGCLWWKDLYAMAAEVGFSPPRFVSTALIDPEREDFKKVLGKNFSSL